jgi:hypothetical protein
MDKLFSNVTHLKITQILGIKNENGHLFSTFLKIFS